MNTSTEKQTNDQYSLAKILGIWLANGILFSFYHLHQPWGILANIPANLVFAYSGKRFR